MKRALPLLLLGFTALAQTGNQPKPLTNADVIEMSRAGVPESTILLAIQNTPAKFDVSAGGILALHAAASPSRCSTRCSARQTAAAEPPPFGVATGTFPVKDAAGKTVRFSAWIKTENVQNGYAGLWWRVDGPGEGTTVRNSLSTTPSTGSSMACRTLAMALSAAQPAPRNGPATSSSYPSARPLRTSISACSSRAREPPGSTR